VYTFVNGTLLDNASRSPPTIAAAVRVHVLETLKQTTRCGRYARREEYKSLPAPDTIAAAVVRDGKVDRPLGYGLLNLARRWPGNTNPQVFKLVIAKYFSDLTTDNVPS
jgi:hypothetical protein